MLASIGEAWDSKKVLKKLQEKKLRIFVENSYKLLWYNNFIEFIDNFDN